MKFHVFIILVPEVFDLIHFRDQSLVHPKTQNHSMPTQPGALYREDSLSSVPDTCTSDSLHNFSGSAIGSISRRNRRSFASLAQKTSNVLASFSIRTTQTKTRSSNSRGSLSRQSTKYSTSTPPIDDHYVQLTETSRPSSPAWVDSSANSEKRRMTVQRLPTSLGNRTAPPESPNMHQTSSRLLRMTEDERPFTKVR